MKEVVIAYFGRFSSEGTKEECKKACCIRPASAYLLYSVPITRPVNLKTITLISPVISVEKFEF
jgi:hypothetical protein